MRILITGANGFIGRNLRWRLRELGHTDIVEVARSTPREELHAALATADFVFHLAGVNRPKNDDEFVAGNVLLTQEICARLQATGRRVPIVLSSSTQAERDNAYGRSKRAAEEALLKLNRETGTPVYVFRLTNVFGKWCRPNYNSAVATFCHQVAHGQPVTINDPAAPLRLVYIDDVVQAFVDLLGPEPPPAGFVEAGPVYATTVGELAAHLREFADSRASLITPRVGSGLLRALYATYMTYLPTQSFAYTVPRYGDPRGVFAEMLKTPDCGQFSYFTAGPGVTRGEHYHHTKTEKFMVVKGVARFGFRHIDTGERYELTVHAGDGQIVETIPGWAHDITNVGEEELIALLWANEIFDRARPDTVRMKVVP